MKNNHLVLSTILALSVRHVRHCICRQSISGYSLDAQIGII
ncbi:hypothetical protein ACFS5N_16550 [Mucilaginibacter ximonensis]|uniref:Uncharacterized protein n=1 Tax=Mucilaginibacter ximonensis TaxID=538021 RepID=A0ABW5YFE6_9SPHI